MATLPLTAVVSGWTDRLHGPQVGALPGLTGFLAALLAVQTVLLVLLAVTVIALAERARAACGYGRVPPYLRGNLATPVAGLGFLLGGLLTAVFNLGAARILGTPVPSGFRFATAPSDALAVPWPVYAFSFAPIGLLCGTVPAAAWLYHRYRRQRRRLQAPMRGDLPPVDADYRSWVADNAERNRDEPADKHRRAIAAAWAVGLLTDDAAPVVALAACTAFAAFVAAFVAATLAGPTSHPTLLADWWHGLATLTALVGILVACWLLMLLRLAYTDTAKRRTIGVLWDVATFWPRAATPSPRPATPNGRCPRSSTGSGLLTGHVGQDQDDVTRLQFDAGQPGPVPHPRTHRAARPCPAHRLQPGRHHRVRGHRPAAARRAPQRRPETLACPARRLYGRAFPAYFGSHQLDMLRHLLGANPTPRGRWKNLCRQSDPIGSWIFAEPRPRLNDDDLTNDVDQPAMDPPVLVPDANARPAANPRSRAVVARPAHGRTRY